MKLKWIGESFILTKIFDALKSSNYFNRPIVQQDQQYEPSSGHSNLPKKGSTPQPSGIPVTPKKRSYLGFGFQKKHSKL